MTTLPAHSMPTSEEDITGDISLKIASLASKGSRNIEDKATEVLHSLPKAADADTQENGCGVDVTTTTTVESRGTFYETIMLVTTNSLDSMHKFLVGNAGINLL